MAINPYQLQDAFRRILGRDAREDELSFFAKTAQDNDLSAFEIGEILQGAPEAQRSLARTDTADYGRFLQQSDDQFFTRAQNSLEAKFKGAGRSASGSAYVAAYVDTAQKMAMARSSQLADFYGQRVNAAAGSEQDRSGYLRDRGYNMADERRQRGYALEDFYMGRDAFNDQRNYLRRQQRGQGIGALAGGSIGAYFGGPIGAMGGGQIGGAAGGIFG